MNDAQNNNGNLAPGTLTLNPTDKFVILKVDEGTKTVIVTGSSTLAVDDVLDILWVATAQAINTLKEKAKSNPPGRIITLPPGSRLANKP